MVSPPPSPSWNDAPPLISIASPNIIHLPPGAILLEAARLVARLRISSLLALDQAHCPMGIVTERNLLRAMHDGLPPTTALAEVMSAPVITMPPATLCGEAYRRCLQEGIRHLVVVDGEGRALAVASETDFRRHLDLGVHPGRTPVIAAMSRAPVTLDGNASLHNALERMHVRQDGAVVVVEGRRPVGILTERDVARLYAGGTPGATTLLRDIMSSPVLTVGMDATLAEAAERMLTARVRRLVVVDATERLVGLLTSQDLTQTMTFGMMDSTHDREKERLHSLLEHAPFPLVVTDMEDGRFLSINAQAIQQLHLDTDSHSGLSIKQLYRDAADRASLLDALRQEGSVFNREIDLIDPQGQPLHVLISSTMIDHDNEPAILAVVNDITPRKLAQQALQQERAKLRTLLHTIPDLVWVKDPNGRFLLCNPAAERLFGLPESSLLGKTDDDFFPREQAEFFRANDRRAITAGQPTTNEEWLCFAEEGYRGLFEVRKTPLLAEDGTLIGVLAIARDITARVQAARVLQESEQRLQAITDSALDGIVMMDPTGAISYWNPAAESIFGYPAEEALGCDLHQLLLPQRQLAQYRGGFPRFQQTGNGAVVGRNLELAAVCKDGREITVSLSVSAVALNGAWHAVGILRDISALKCQQNELQTALRAAESANQSKEDILTHLEELVAARTAELDAVNERLRISEERYTLALEASNDGLWDWDLRTGQVYCNPAYFRMLGFEPGEIEPDIKNWSGLAHPDDRERTVAEAHRRIAEEGGFELEFRMRAKNGRYIWILSRGKVVARDPDGQPVRVVGLHTDLTARKQIEQELRTAAEEQRAIFDAAASGIGFIRDRVVVRCNRKLEEIFGYEPGEMAGTTTRSWYPTETAFIQTGQEVQGDLHATGKHYAERQLARRDGSLFWARMNAQAMDPSDLSKGLVGMLDDITEERQAAEALRKAKEAAEAATRAKSEFLANMSHEIRTPMNAILGFAHLLRRDPLTPLQTSHLERLSDSARHLLKIINDVLDISKIEASKLELETEDFEPARVIDQVCAIVSDKITAKHLQLRVELAHIPPVVRGDGSRLGQILLNLLGNAVKFTEQGTVTIGARIIDQQTDRLVLRFEVRDTGIGMTGEQLDRVFLAFEQADSSMTRRFGGTGLGLAISKRLVDLMGGRMGVDSQPGQGTLFWVELPFATVSPPADTGLHREDVSPVRALIVAQDATLTASLSTMLAELGIQADTATSGEAGLTQVLRSDRAKAPLTLLVLDWQRCGMTAGETLHSLRFLNLRVRPTVLAVIPAGDLSAREEAGRQGSHGVLTKPVTPSALRQALMAVIPDATGAAPAVRTVEQELARRRGRHILLVEDNPVNQEVAHMLLEGLGMRVRVADNGQQAVELFTAEPVDLILMDMQMPVLDGLQATAAIRGLATGHTVPILAMTANVFSEDREQCLRVGMNDYIAKPIELDKLHAILIKWLPPRPENPDTPPEPSADGDASPPGDDLLAQLATIQGLDIAAGLHVLLDDPPRYLQLLRQFVEQHGQDGALLARQAAAGDPTLMGQTAHALKGAAATLGARRIEDLAADLERMIRQNPAESRWDERIAHLGSALDALARAVGEITAPASRQHTFPVDWSRIDELLTRLATFLAMEDASANDLFEQARAELLAAFGDQARALGGQIEAFDYADALRTVQTLLDTAANR